MKTEFYSISSRELQCTRCLRCALLITSLMLSTIISHAQLGSGWVSQSPTKAIHIDGDTGDPTTFAWSSYQSNCSPTKCAEYSYDAGAQTETFRIFDGRSNRSEIRLYNDYTTGSRQFEGYVTFYSPLNDECLMQIWGSTEGATQLMIRGFSANGGSLMVGGVTLISGCYGQEVRVNVIHLQENVGNKIAVYINGVKKLEIPDSESVSNYHKYGCYGSTNGNVPAVVKWRRARFFRDGTEPAATTLYQDCSYGGYAAGFGVGNYTLSNLNARGVSNDDVSSLKVASGHEATFYEHDNFLGATLTVTANNSCLVGAGWNDRVSSMRVTFSTSARAASGSTLTIADDDTETGETNAISASPNPATGGKVKLEYSVEEDGYVRININTINGQEIKTLVNEHKPRGKYSVTWETGATPKGIYFAKMLRGRDIKTIKLVLEE